MEPRGRSPPNSEIGKLLFELASDDRLALLDALGLRKEKVTRLASRISASTQETSKHLSRLHYSGLVERDREGYYRLTAMGGTVMRLLPSFRFLTRNAPYFQTHDLGLLPPQFVSRIGELSNCDYVDYTGLVLAFYEEVVSEAEEYICVVMDHQIRTNMTIAAALAEKRVRVEYMVPDGPEVRRDHDEAKRLMGELLEVRLSDEIHVGIMLDEKKAGVAFPDLSGRVDYNKGFRSSDARFRRWCEDLFDFQWKTAKGIGVAPDSPSPLQRSSPVGS